MELLYIITDTISTDMHTIEFCNIHEIGREKAFQIGYLLKEF